MAATWFPVNDHPRDKATYTISDRRTGRAVRALQRRAAGQARPPAASPPGRWSVTKPMAPYLATVVIGDYRVQESTHDGMPVALRRRHVAADRRSTRSSPGPPRSSTSWRRSSGRTRSTRSAASSSTTGGSGFALENQTRPIYGRAFFDAGEDGTWVIVHELAHQWFGDSVSVNEWKRDLAQRGLRHLRRVAVVRGTRAPRPHSEIFDQIYSDGQRRAVDGAAGRPRPRATCSATSVYVRGAMTLHALRVTVGDEDFFTILKAWAAREGATATPPPRSSSRSPSGSPASSSTSSSTTGCTAPSARPALIWRCSSAVTGRYGSPSTLR